MGRTAGSSSGQKRKSAGGGDEEGELVADEPLWRLSLGSIYGSSAGLAAPPMNAPPCLHVTQAPPVPRRTSPVSPPAAVSLVAHVQMHADGAAFIAAGAGQVLSSPTLFDVVASAAIPLAAKQAAAPPLVPPIKQDAVAPRASPPAHHQSPRRRVTNSALPQPAAVDGATAANNAITVGASSATASPPSINGATPASPLFPWATNRAAIHHPVSYLFERGITTVEGEVKCKRCDLLKTVSYNIAVKFKEVRDFVSHNIHDMDDRAPKAWMSPVVPDCDGCGQRNSLRPVIPKEKERVNWVFLLLGQTLGLCSLEHLKYFCACTGQHRTGAKDRVLYSTYMELCSQLCPDRLFNLTAERQKRGQQYS
ncbi:unnamed protein product [Triticum turgidum subsp. durum]|uniref:DUF7086 domain-containing protein n=1 Tax=Triticum turgidum subsp. durum TaxID=4567 RepID=A0A9R0QJ87_TRITD|nr:unnamed protein product [Triticum turgidum subsp. durum]